MDIVWTLIIGFLAGVMAKFIMPGKEPGGIIITVALGIAGAFVATYLGRMLNFYQAGETAGFIGSVVGAVIILAVYRMFKGKKR